MANPPPISNSTAAPNAPRQRLGGPSAILDRDALTRQSAARLVAELLMCDPAYVLTVADRERLTVADSSINEGLPGAAQSSP